jgi:hypothetical protein
MTDPHNKETTVKLRSLKKACQDGYQASGFCRMYLGKFLSFFWKIQLKYEQEIARLGSMLNFSPMLICSTEACCDRVEEDMMVRQWKQSTQYDKRVV